MKLLPHLHINNHVWPAGWTDITALNKRFNTFFACCVWQAMQSSVNGKCRWRETCQWINCKVWRNLHTYSHNLCFWETWNTAAYNSPNIHLLQWILPFFLLHKQVNLLTSSTLNLKKKTHLEEKIPTSFMSMNMVIFANCKHVNPVIGISTKTVKVCQLTFTGFCLNNSISNKLFVAFIGCILFGKYKVFYIKMRPPKFCFFYIWYV